MKAQILFIITFFISNLIAMSESTNEVTIESYETSIQNYISGTPQEVTGDVKDWIDKFLTKANKDDVILEIGSGFGRDAKYIQSLGYNVELTDATKGFVDLLQKDGYSAGVFNVLKDDINQSYSLIFANAVFLHFNPEELKLILNKVYNSLKSNGILAFTMKHGEGECISDQKLGAPRYFCYWKPEELKSLLINLGFVNIELTFSVDNKWLSIIAQKL